MDSSQYPNQVNNGRQEDDPEEIQTPTCGGKRKQTPDDDGVTQPDKVRKILNPRSDVWENFTRTKDNRDFCICHYCKKQFSCNSKSGTSSLKKHLLICKQYEAWLGGQNKTQPIINDEGNLKEAKVSEAVVREATNEMLVLGELPLSFIESLAWKHFCKKVNLYKPHSRSTATRDILQMYVDRKATLKKMISKNKQRVSLTTDIWVAQPTCASYMVITVHFVDAKWELKKLIIGFKYVMDHKGQTIATVLLDCLADWGIDKLFCVTVDNATANTSALKKFQREFSPGCSDSLVLGGECLHMRCCGHILNLIAMEGLSELSENVSAIRNAVQYVRSSTTRLNSFEQKVDSGRMTRGCLPLDVKTRWNSTFLMLSKALVFRVAFSKMEADDKLFYDYFSVLENGKKRCGPPSIADWNAAERLVKLFAIFYNSTLVVSASTKVNSYKCYGEIVTIERILRSLSNSLDKDLKKKATEMLQKFEKYWDGLKNINKMLIVATIFDPRKKMNYAKLCFEKLYGKDSLDAREMYQSVYDLVGCMFREYDGRFSKGSGLQSSQSTQTSSLSGQDVLERLELVNDEFSFERMDFLYDTLVDETGVEDTLSELDRYLKEPVENPKLMLGTEYDVLSYWRLNCSQYPVLAEMARDLLAMQVSSVASESAFSTSGRIVDSCRSCLTHYMIEVLMCTEQWMKADIQFGETAVLTNERILADIDMQDKIEKEYDNPYGEED